MSGGKSSVASADRTCAIGLDVGGTKIAAGLVSPRGDLLDKRVIPTLPQRGGQAVLNDVLSLAHAVRNKAGTLGFDVAAIGVGVCELVSPQQEIISNQTVQWRGLPIREQIGALAPCRVDADSRTAAFAEACWGAAKPFGTFFYVTVGTGIGSSWVRDRAPFPGANGCAGTLASSPISVLCTECGAVREAILEEVASGPALVTRFNQRTGGCSRSAEEVLSAASSGNADALWVIETAAGCLGSALALSINVLDPEALLVGGGLGSAPGIFWARLVPAVRAHIWSEVNRGLPILQASRAEDSGIVGAATLALHQFAPESVEFLSGCNSIKTSTW